MNVSIGWLSQCWYYTLDVVTLSGCPGGIYGEVSIEKNDTVVGWTNDSLSRLDADQKGRLQFVT